MSIRFRNVIRRIAIVILALCIIFCASVWVLTRIRDIQFGYNEYWEKPVNVTMPDVRSVAMIFIPDSRDWERYYKGGETSWSTSNGRGVMKITHADVKLLNILKMSYGLHNEPKNYGTKGYVIHILATHVISPDKAPRSEHYFVYFPETGEIGSVRDKWMFVPDEIKKLIQAEIKKKHLPIQYTPR